MVNLEEEEVEVSEQENHDGLRPTPEAIESEKIRVWEGELLQLLAKSVMDYEGKSVFANISATGSGLFINEPVVNAIKRKIVLKYLEEEKYYAKNKPQIEARAEKKAKKIQDLNKIGKAKDKKDRNENNEEDQGETTVQNTKRKRRRRRRGRGGKQPINNSNQE